MIRFMARSLRVQSNYINQVKLALRRNGFRSQRALAEEVGFSLATVSNFLTGKPVDFATFEELCVSLALDWKEIANLDFQVSSQTRDKNPKSSKWIESDPNTFPLYPSGAVPLASPYYIKRSPIEEEVYQEISKPGALVRIKAPREMGKTSVLLRVLNYAKSQGYCTVSLNLEQVDQAILDDLTQFLRWLCANVARQLQLKPKLDDYWDEDLGSKISCSSYFEDYLFKSIDTPLVLALDEVNQIFEHPQVAKDFLSLLRSWYEQGKTLSIWQKFRLIVVHSTEIYVPLDINQSPFNVGLPVQLNHFSLEEVQQLAQRYGLNWLDGKEGKQLMMMIEGHPSLIHTAIYHLYSKKITLAQLLKSAPTTTGIYSHHLHCHLVTLQEQPKLAQALDALSRATEPVELDSRLAYKLSRLGLIKQFGDKARPRCELYRQFFSKGTHRFVNGYND